MLIEISSYFLFNLILFPFVFNFGRRSALLFSCIIINNSKIETNPCLVLEKSDRYVNAYIFLSFVSKGDHISGMFIRHTSYR